MATVKRTNAQKTNKIAEYMEAEDKAFPDDAMKAFELELLSEVEGDTVFIHNVSGAEFHVPPTSFDPKHVESADIIVFEVNQVLPFNKTQVSTQQFKKCILSKKLKIVSADEANLLRAKAEKELRKENKSAKSGVAESGLPKNNKAAAMYVLECEDIDELEGYLEIEERDAIVSLIEDRIEELEESGLAD
jgi:hypothetical protein